MRNIIQIDRFEYSQQQRQSAPLNLRTDSIILILEEQPREPGPGPINNRRMESISAADGRRAGVVGAAVAGCELVFRVCAVFCAESE